MKLRSLIEMLKLVGKDMALGILGRSFYWKKLQ